MIQFPEIPELVHAGILSNSSIHPALSYYSFSAYSCFVLPSPAFSSIIQGFGCVSKCTGAHAYLTIDIDVKCLGSCIGMDGCISRTGL